MVKEGGWAARAFAALVVALRPLIPIAWVAAAVAATIALPELGAEAAGPIGGVVPKDSEAEQAAQTATQEFGFPLIADTVVVQANDGGLPTEVQRRQLRAALATDRGRGVAPGELRAAVPITNSPGGPLGVGTNATTALTYLIFSPGVGVADRTEIAEGYAAQALGGAGGDVVGVTGPAPARQAEFEAIDNALPIIEAASVLAVLLIVGIAFRSLGAPLITLFTGAVAYLLMVRVLPWVGDRLDVTIPAEAEPVLVVLLLGLVTDYSVFFLSGMRRRLERGDEKLPAARTAIAETAPLVFAAGLIVAAGTAALLVGKLDFFRAFGPGLAITTLISLVVAATLVPALIALFGARLFGRRRRGPIESGAAPDEGRPDAPAIDRVRRDLHLDRDEAEGGRNGPVARRRRALARPLLAIRRTDALRDAAQTSRWRVVVARIASARPVAIAIALVTIAGLLAAASGLRSTALGFTFISGLSTDSDVRQAADAASRGFAPGVLAPTEVDLTQPGIASRRAELAQLERLIDQQPGVAAVIGPGEQPPPPTPQVMVAGGGAARLAVVFDDDPLGAPAIDTLSSLQARMPALLSQAGLDPGAEASFGGQTALAQESVDAVLDDLKRIGAAALLANLLLLMIFLRALVAPVYLVAASLLGLAATLGLATFFFQGLLGRDELTYYVPFAAAILLVALGSDYNVFVAGRIWKEARWRRLPEAIAVAAPSAAKAITVAGIALAASFALLAIVPLGSFQEFAFVMVVGVLIDTFIVRSLLIPALTAIVGERAWWPGRRVVPISSEAFTERVADHADLPLATAERASEAALTTLGERIDARERQEMARRLPEHLGGCLLCSDAEPQPFDAAEFLARMRERENGTSDSKTQEHARAVLTTLGETSPGELDYVRVQLTADYDDLFGKPAARAIRPRSPSPPPRARA